MRLNAVFCVQPPHGCCCYSFSIEFNFPTYRQTAAWMSRWAAGSEHVIVKSKVQLRTHSCAIDLSVSRANYTLECLRWQTKRNAAAKKTSWFCSPTSWIWCVSACVGRFFIITGWSARTSGMVNGLTADTHTKGTVLKWKKNKQQKIKAG